MFRKFEQGVRGFATGNKSAKKEIEKQRGQHFHHLNNNYQTARVSLHQEIAKQKEADYKVLEAEWHTLSKQAASSINQANLHVAQLNKLVYGLYCFEQKYFPKLAKSYLHPYDPCYDNFVQIAALNLCNLQYSRLSFTQYQEHLSAPEMNLNQTFAPEETTILSENEENQAKLKPNEYLLSSAAQGNTLGIQEALHLGADIHAVDSEQCSALQLALLNDSNISSLHTLLMAGAAISYKSNSGPAHQSSLELALEKSSFEFWLLLANRPLEIQTEADKKLTKQLALNRAFLRAVSFQDIPGIHKAIAEGAEVNALDNRKRNALQNAFYYQLDSSLIAELIKLGLSITYKHHDYDAEPNAYELAHRYKRQECIELMQSVDASLRLSGFSTESRIVPDSTLSEQDYDLSNQKIELDSRIDSTIGTLQEHKDYLIKQTQAELTKITSNTRETTDKSTKDDIANIISNASLELDNAMSDALQISAYNEAIANLSLVQTMAQEFYAEYEQHKQRILAGFTAINTAVEELEVSYAAHYEKMTNELFARYQNNMHSLNDTFDSARVHVRHSHADNVIKLGISIGMGWAFTPLLSAKLVGVAGMSAGVASSVATSLIATSTQGILNKDFKNLAPNLIKNIALSAISTLAAERFAGCALNSLPVSSTKHIQAYAIKSAISAGGQSLLYGGKVFENAVLGAVTAAASAKLVSPLHLEEGIKLSISAGLSAAIVATYQGGDILGAACTQAAEAYISYLTNKALDKISKRSDNIEMQLQNSIDALEIEKTQSSPPVNLTNNGNGNLENQSNNQNNSRSQILNFTPQYSNQNQPQTSASSRPNSKEEIYDNSDSLRTGHGLDGIIAQGLERHFRQLPSLNDDSSSFSSASYASSSSKTKAKEINGDDWLRAAHGFVLGIGTNAAAQSLAQIPQIAPLIRGAGANGTVSQQNSNKSSTYNQARNPNNSPQNPSPSLAPSSSLDSNSNRFGNSSQNDVSEANTPLGIRLLNLISGEADASNVSPSLLNSNSESAFQGQGPLLSFRGPAPEKAPIINPNNLFTPLSAHVGVPYAPNITRNHVMNFSNNSGGTFTPLKDGFTWIKNKVDSGHNALDKIDRSREQIYQQHPQLRQYEQHYSEGTDRARLLLDLIPTTPTEALIEIATIEAKPLLKGANFVYKEGKIFYRAVNFAKEANLDHVFSKIKNLPKEGHLVDTLLNRRLILKTITPENLVGVTFKPNTKTGGTVALEWYAKIQKDGSQSWSFVIDGRIKSAGLNKIPKEFHPEHGLCNPIKPKGPKP